MKYSYELFLTDQEKSLVTKYAYRLSGAFYDCYTDDFRHFYRSQRDKESLLARREFYQTYLRKEPYPVFASPYKITNGQSTPGEVLFQVLGLPLPVRTKPGNGQTSIPLTCDEILSRITFDPILSSDRGDGPSEKDYHELYTNDYCLIEARNDLISKGIFCQHPELISDPETRQFPSYPIHILEDRIPKKYIREKETGAKLFMDFVPYTPEHTAEVFKKYYAPLDHRSLEERAQLAFHVDDENTPDLEFERNQALRRYFAGLMGRIRNDFFKKYFLIPNRIGFTALDTDLGFDFTNAKYRAVGPLFTRYGSDLVHTIHTVNGKLTEDIEPILYEFDSRDKKAIGDRFDFVYRYRAQHKESGFHPAYFLKRMGRPYACYPIVQYFDFSCGDRDSFLSHLSFVSKPAKAERFGYPTPYLGDYGRLFFDFVGCQEEQEFYHRKRRAKAGRQRSDFISEEGMDDFLIICNKSTKEEVSSLCEGKYSFYRKNQEHKGKEDLFNQWLRYASSHLDSKGRITPIPEIFRLRSEGHTFREACSLLKLTREEEDRLIFGVHSQIDNRFPGKCKHPSSRLEAVDIVLEPLTVKTEDNEYPELLVYPIGRAFKNKDGQYFIDDDYAALIEKRYKTSNPILAAMSLSSYTGDSYRYGRYFSGYDALTSLHRIGRSSSSRKKNLFAEHYSFFSPRVEKDSALLSSARQTLAAKDGFLFFACGFEQFQGLAFIYDDLSDERKRIFDPELARLSTRQRYALEDTSKTWEEELDIARKQGFLAPVHSSCGDSSTAQAYSSRISFFRQRKYWRRARGFTFDQAYFGSLEFDNHQIAVGTNFYAFKRKDGGYALPLEDKEAVEFAYKTIRNNDLYFCFAEKKTKNRFRVSALGLPFARIKGKRDITNLVKSIRYEKIDADTSDYPTYSTAFSTRRSQLDSVPFRTETCHRLLHRGRFIFYPSLVFADDNPDRCDLVCIQNPTGIVKDIFYPDSLTLENLLDQFRKTKEYSGEEQFYYKEYAFWAYSKHPGIFAELLQYSFRDASEIRKTLIMIGKETTCPIDKCRKKEQFDGILFLKDFAQSLFYRCLTTVADQAIKEKHEKEIRKK